MMLKCRLSLLFKNKCDEKYWHLFFLYQKGTYFTNIPRIYIYSYNIIYQKSIIQYTSHNTLDSKHKIYLFKNLFKMQTTKYIIFDYVLYSHCEVLLNILIFL